MRRRFHNNPHWQNMKELQDILRRLRMKHDIYAVTFICPKTEALIAEVEKWYYMLPNFTISLSFLF